MANPVMESYQTTLFQNANVQVVSGPGTMGGIFISSASNTPLLTVNDSLANGAGNGNSIIQQFIPVVATYYRFPAHFNAGLNVTVGGNIAGTVFWNK